MVLIRCSACDASWRQLLDDPIPDQCAWCEEYETLYVAHAED